MGNHLGTVGSGQCIEEDSSPRVPVLGWPPTFTAIAGRSFGRPTDTRSQVTPAESLRPCTKNPAGLVHVRALLPLAVLLVNRLLGHAEALGDGFP